MAHVEIVLGGSKLGAVGVALGGPGARLDVARCSRRASARRSTGRSPSEAGTEKDTFDIRVLF